LTRGRSPLEPVADALCRALAPLRFGAPVAYVYNPLVYARAPYREYLRRYARGPKEVLLFGMNPGPFGMAQTGIPFGAVGAVRDFLGIEAAVGRPEREHPRRPVLGFACPREEVSGARLWGLIRERFGSAERFFARCLVVNYCPLLFLEASGRNRTPAELPAAERAPLLRACDAGLRRTAELLRPRLVIGIGRFAEARAREVLGESGVALAALPHPSPASPAANRGWARAAGRVLGDLGVA
jgi:single-strand selective monofunctional uracil DNA glycosylase